MDAQNTPKEDNASKGPYYNYFTTFHRISTIMGSTLKLDELFPLFLKNLTESLQIKSSTLVMIDEASNELRHTHSFGLSDEYLAKGPIDLDRSVLDREKGKPVLIKDAATDDRVQYREAAGKEGIASILVVPVKAKEKVIGALQLYTATPCTYTEDDISFVSSLAEVGGLALENARLYQKRKDDNRLFWELAKSINSSIKLNEVLESMVRSITKAMDLKGCVIRLFDEKRKVLELMASFGLSQKYLKKGKIDIDKSSIEPLEGKPAYVADAGTDTRLQYREEAREEGIASILSVPMKVKEKIVGVMRLYTHSRREFDSDEMIFIGAIADLGGIAVENAVMFRNVQGDYEDLRDNLWSYRAWF